MYDKFPPLEKWDHWEEYDPKSGQKKKRKLIPLSLQHVLIVKVLAV